MPYLPPGTLNNTTFPTGSAKDVATQVRIQVELYRRQYPALPYFMIKKAITPVAHVGELTGAAGTTKFDTLYGEAVDAAEATWRQPHLSDTLQAANPELFNDAIPLNLRIRRITRETELKKLGTDPRREIMAYVPVALLDVCGITCQAGDYFLWDGKPYEVLVADPQGYFYNTNIRTYMVLSCKSKMMGS